MRCPPFVQSLRHKEEQIEEIKLRAIFLVAEDDFKKAEKEYKKVTTIGELLPNDHRTGQMVTCYLLTNDMMKARKIYRTMDIVELWELYSIKAAADYQNPYMERKDG